MELPEPPFDAADRKGCGGVLQPIRLQAGRNDVLENRQYRACKNESRKLSERKSRE